MPFAVVLSIMSTNFQNLSVMDKCYQHRQWHFLTAT